MAGRAGNHKAGMGSWWGETAEGAEGAEGRDAKAET